MNQINSTRNQLYTRTGPIPNILDIKTDIKTFKQCI